MQQSGNQNVGTPDGIRRTFYSRRPQTEHSSLQHIFFGVTSDPNNLCGHDDDHHVVGLAARGWGGMMS
jgi:hypothetical protein